MILVSSPVDPIFIPDTGPISNLSYSTDACFIKPDLSRVKPPSTQTFIPVINLECLLKDGHFDNFYGVCNQLLDISYVREYFLVKDIRVTIDKEIKYRLVNLNRQFKNIFFF